MLAFTGAIKLTTKVAQVVSRCLSAVGQVALDKTRLVYLGEGI